MLESVETRLATEGHSRLTTKNAEAWLLTLCERIAEVDEGTEEAFEYRRELAKLLVEKVTAGRDQDGHITVHITYRFVPPGETDPDEDEFVSGVKNSSRSSALNG